jgi:hypothetical protein
MGWLLTTSNWAAHKGIAQQLCVPMQPDWSTLPPLTWINHYIFVSFMVLTGGTEA